MGNRDRMRQALANKPNVPPRTQPAAPITAPKPAGGKPPPFKPKKKKPADRDKKEELGRYPADTFIGCRFDGTKWVSTAIVPQPDGPPLQFTEEFTGVHCTLGRLWRAWQASLRKGDAKPAAEPPGKKPVDTPPEV